MAASALNRHPIAVTVAGALVFAVVVAQVGLALTMPDEWQHVLSHTGPGIAALFLVAASRRMWPPPAASRPSRVSRTVLVIGLALFGVGQIVEAVGAFGYSGNTRVSNLALVHDVGVVLSPVGLLVTLAGATASGFVTVAGRHGELKRSTVKVGVIAAVAVVVAYVVAGIVLGF